MIFQYEMKMKYNSRKKTAANSLFFDNDSIDLDYYIIFSEKFYRTFLFLQFVKLQIFRC